MMETSIHVVVIGAGAAGLEAARCLSCAGIGVTLLEARSRIGGRILTLHDPQQPVPIELGAEFVHGRNAETWDLIRQRHLAAYDVSENEEFTPPGRTDAEAISRGFEEVLGRLQEQRGSDQSFSQFLEASAADASAEVKAAVSAYIEGFYAADQQLVSTHWLRETEREVGPSRNRSFRIQSGHDRIAQAILDGCDQRYLSLRLSCAVTCVRWQAGSVLVDMLAPEGREESLRVDRAVIAVPLGVLQAPRSAPGAIAFEPPLAEKQAALESLQMGPVVKVVLAFQEPIWEERSQDVTFFHAPQETFATWWTMHPMRTSLLVGWAGGSRAQPLVRLSRLEVIDRALASASAALAVDRTRLEAQLVASHAHDWQGDPFSRGAYSYAVVGGAGAPSELAAPIESTLFFAGEATHPTLGGTVAGAIASGRRAAEEVLSTLRIP